MLYHKFMAYRVRSSTRLRGIRMRRRGHPLLSFTTLSSLGLFATAIYASIGVFDYTIFNNELGQKGIVWEFTTAEPRNTQDFIEINELNEIGSLVTDFVELPEIDLLGTSRVFGFSSKIEVPNSGSITANAALLADLVKATPAFKISKIADLPRDTESKLDSEKVKTFSLSLISAKDKITIPEVIPAIQAKPQSAPEVSRWLEASVSDGDSLSILFSRLGLSANLLHNIVSSGKEAKELSKILPGEILRVELDEEGKFNKLILERNALSSLQVIAVDGGYEASLASKPVEIRRSQMTGVITDSLYNSAMRMGMSDGMVMELTEIFGWDIDFALDIQRGDSFAVVFEEQYVDGKKFSSGNILAAEFVNNGKVYRAVRFENDKGKAEYFTPDGKGMRKAFLRAPVDFRRISSKFTQARNHPVLGKVRPHRGVDYAAARGTPIRAAGSGKITFRGTKGGYGKTIIIKHDGSHTTLYAHMSKYSSRKKGSRVKQGDIIGYVGSTGLATGPHLHYEFRVNNVHLDPLKAKMTRTVRLAKKYRRAFKQESTPLITQLNRISAVRLAKAN